MDHPLPSLVDLSDLARRVDDEAEHWLASLAPAAGALPPSPAARRTLAQRLERWRYHLLDKHHGPIAPLERRLVEQLDLLANHLAGRRPRAPRSPSAAVQPPDQSRGLERALSAVDPRAWLALDPRVPLADVTRWAAEQTCARFSAAASFSADPRSGRAGRRMLLYAPLYLSSHCINHCRYCAFRYPHPLQREHLRADEAVQQAEILWQRGLRHLLLVAGDFPSLTTTDYFADVARRLTSRGFSIAVEVAPQSTADYAQLARAGVRAVTLYQETYQPQLYARYHPRGTKARFDWRLEAPERAAEAGIERLGLGILLGLAPLHDDLAALVRHACYLVERFAGLRLAFSLPRIHEAPDGFEPPHPVDDESLLRCYCALRLAFPRAELVLSTRERPELRDRLAAVCITQLSAESCTSPGGYGRHAAGAADRQQFPVADHRSVRQVAAELERWGFRVRFSLD